MDPVIHDYRSAPISPATRSLLDWCVKLTRAPATCTEEDICALRAADFTDAQISAAAMVCSYFNFINRVADGLGVDHEDWMDERAPLGPCPW